MKNSTYYFAGKIILKSKIAIKKKCITSICLLLVMLLATSDVDAQFTTAASYPFEASSKTFTYLSGGTSVNTQGDDRTVTGIPIGFTFTYCGNNYTTVSACSNGWLAFGTKTSTQYSNSQSNAGSITPMLMPIWDDLQGAGSVSTYMTSGAVGERIFTFEWRNTRPLSSTTNPEITIQVKLYEGDNAIEFLYKQEIGTANFSSATIGIVGNSNSDYQTLNNSTASPTPSSTTFTTNITAKPATGQSYLWGYLRKGYNNAAIGGIASPANAFCAGVTLPIDVFVQNVGKNNINNVEVHWKLDNIVQPTVNWNTVIETLGSSAGNTATVHLDNVFFGATPRSFEIYTSLPNGVADTVNGDDTLRIVIGAALNGVYTIGGTAPDFPDVVTVANVLNQFGVCGPVTFNIRPGTYNQGTVTVSNILGASTTNTITFQSENSNANTAIISNGGRAFALESSSHIRIRNLTISSTTLAYALSMIGSVSDISITGCNINAPLSASPASAAFVATTLSGTNTNIEFKNNVFTGGFYSFIWDGNPSSYTSDLLVENNTLSQYYDMGMYFYYTNGLKAKGNTITGTQTSLYGLYAAYTRQSPEITGNKISVIDGYALLADYMSGVSANDKGIVANNVTTMIGGTDNYAGIYINYPENMQMYNNTSYATGSYSTCYTFALYMPSGYNNNETYNNLSVNTGGGYAVYIDNSGTNNTIDYNNWYTSASTNRFYYNGDRADFDAYRTASGTDKHSLTYNPQVNNDGSPNPNNPACWSLNGRGLHIANNDKDVNGNIRVTQRKDGVPDIGAFEFLPESKPPLATITPSVADPGDSQVFTFGGNEVGRISWGYNAPTAQLEVRQYSGEKGVGIAAAASPFGSMYFHTDIKSLGSGSTFDYELDVNYMDIWLGDIANENDLRLAHRLQPYQWMVYSNTLSNVNTINKTIHARALSREGSFTGLENGSILSAFVQPQDKTVICIGTSVLLNAEPQNGDLYKWFRNGTEIIGANTKSYTATLAGDYSVQITFSGKIVESVPVTISTIAAPNAVINANGTLTYCIGNGLVLNAGNTTGVTYQWHLNGVKIPGATNNTYPVSQAGNYRVNVENFGCASLSTPTTITSGPLNVSLGNDTSYCEIKNVYAKLDAGYPGAKYLWSTGDTTQTILVKASGKYAVQVDAGPNCIDNDDIVVTIDPLPKANGISFVRNGNSYQFFPSGPVGASGFLWLFSDGSNTTQTNPTRTITGDLYVRLVLFNACGSDTVQLGWPLAVESVVEEQIVTIYPNPARNHVTVKGTRLENVEILNSVGSVVYRSDVNTDTYRIDVSGLANGHYVLRASATSGVITKQFDILK